MFSNLRYYLRDYRLWMILGLLAAAAVAYFGTEGLREIGLWAAAVLAVCLTIWLLVWIVRRIIARRAARSLDAMVQGEADRAVAAAQPANRADTEALRSRMLEAVKAIKSSRLGVLKGKAALYELPWYVIIGNPAAGKSTAILNSGLQFPFEDNRGNVIQGIGGTRNCDWYFTMTGIVLDTAGRYSVSVEDRLEWLTFLALLKSTGRARRSTASSSPPASPNCPVASPSSRSSWLRTCASACRKLPSAWKCSRRCTWCLPRPT